MTIRTIHILAVTFVLALFYQESRVDAGFVSLGLATVEGESSQITDKDFEARGANAGSWAFPDDSNHGHRHKAIFEMPQLAVDLAILHGGVGSSTGMSIPQPELGHGSSMVAIGLNSNVSEGPLAVWIGPEGRSLLPPPLGTRLMRPPRFAG
jgi:hypothetical protein